MNGNNGVNSQVEAMDDGPGPVSRSERVSLRRPLGHRGLETLAAHYVRQRFKPHSHPEYLIGVITGGVHSVWCRGERHTALPGTVMSMRPGDVHHGNAAVEAGWMQRMFYVAEDTMREILGDRLDASTAPLPDFERCDRHDPLLAVRLKRIHDRIHASRLMLSRDAAWADFADVVAVLAGGAPGDDSPGALPDTRARAMVDYLHAHVGEDVSLDTLSSLAGLRRRQTIDLFKRETGLPPHAYHIGLKVRLVQDRLRKGHAPAAAAMEAGFADQSHMARHFSAIVGLTPAAYAQADRVRTFVL
ncbi:AraC family transcriptional regulator [Aureimonas sp. Leaf454]|uniref:AraC family transcriptional regulator n=1 Tax=Aureimonas sp. Leaf454 TaxID=1736381 RepID=UPI001FCD2418|nr:AraC family transcriptional regulator [Aureimonas sp. Leaf454]